ncbi:MAG TPA: hypothetical protein VFJ43_02875, partial [Bacteroidia bacterium]|nr:hypothetical protein [Bacteroidia bacterium]
PDGPLYTIESSEVSKIVYANGHVDMFSGETDYSSVQINYPFHKWTASLNAFDLMFGMISVSGEYTSQKNMLTVRIPLSCGVAAIGGKTPGIGYNSLNYYYYNKDKIFSTGVDLRFFPMKEIRKINYYLGVSFEFGMINYMSYTNSGYPYYTYDYKTHIASYTGTGVTNGVLIRASDHITIGLDFTAGMMVTNAQNNRSDYHPMARFGANMGYSFGE